MIIFNTVMMKDAGEKYEDIPGWHGLPPKEEEALEILHNLGYGYKDFAEARAEYGEPVYDGTVPPPMSSRWVRVVHADSMKITAGGE